MQTNNQFAIVNEVKTSLKALAICEVWTYDVWGNAEDGYEVNDRSCSERECELHARCILSNVPRRPGAKDDFRSFTDEPSFNAEVMVSFVLSDTAVCRALGCDADEFEVESDGVNYYVTRVSDGFPIGEIIIMEWRDME